MNDTPTQPVKRKLLALLCSLPWLPSCSSAITSWSTTKAGATAPFYRSLPVMIESRHVSTMSGEKEEVRYQAGFWTLSRDDFYTVFMRLIKKALSLGRLPLLDRELGSGALPGPHLGLVTNKRVFLVSIKPDILLLVPWSFQMENGRDGKPYWSSSHIEKQLGTLHEEQEKRFGLVYTVKRTASGEALIVELSNVFPDVNDIEAISDTWDNVRSLAQMEADPSLPFRTEFVTGMPGFRRLILR